MEPELGQALAEVEALKEQVAAKDKEIAELKLGRPCACSDPVERTVRENFVGAAVEVCGAVGEGEEQPCGSEAGEDDGSSSDAAASDHLNSTKPKKKKSASRSSRSLCVAWAKSASTVLELACGGAGWSAVDTKKKGCTVYWVSSENDFEQAVMHEGKFTLKKSQRVNRIPMMPQICSKVLFSMLMARVRSNECSCDFYPETWVLRGGANPALQRAMKSGKSTFIMKPDDGSQGDGISLVQGWQSLQSKLRASGSSGPVIVQRYIGKPMLLEGLKFDFRVYVGVLGGGKDSSQVFLFHEGLARFCTETYVEPAPQNFHNVLAHLTNYSLNKRSKQFDHGDEADEEQVLHTGSKRLLSGVVHQLDALGLISREAFFEELDRIVSGTFEAITPVLGEAVTELLGDSSESKAGCLFHLLGFDVMLDAAGRAHLLEVNNHPSLQINTVTFDKEDCKCMDSHLPHSHEICPVDERVKKTVVQGMLRLVTSKDTLTLQEDLHNVSCGDGGAWTRVHRLYKQVAGRKMSGQRFRSFLTKTGLVHGQLASHEADVLYLKWQQMNATEYDATGMPDSISFCSMLYDLAMQKFPDAPCPLTQLVEQAVASGYEC